MHPLSRTLQAPNRKGLRFRARPIADPLGLPHAGLVTQGETVEGRCAKLCEVVAGHFVDQPADDKVGLTPLEAGGQTERAVEREAWNPAEAIARLARFIESCNPPVVGGASNRRLALTRPRAFGPIPLKEGDAAPARAMHRKVGRYSHPPYAANAGRPPASSKVHTLSSYLLFARFIPWFLGRWV